MLKRIRLDALLKTLTECFHRKLINQLDKIEPVVFFSDSTVTDEQKRQAWEEVALLQVEAKRIYTTNKRYRKFVST